LDDSANAQVEQSQCNVNTQKVYNVTTHILKK